MRGNHNEKDYFRLEITVSELNYLIVELQIERRKLIKKI